MGGSGNILFTTTNSDLVQITGTAVALEPFTPHEGALLLLRHLRRHEVDPKHPDFILAMDLSSSLGGLGVALSHFAGFMEKSQYTLVEMRDLLASRSRTKRAYNANCSTYTHQYHHTLETMWDIALAELDDDTRESLDIMAMLNADMVQEDMIFSHCKRDRPDQ